MATKNDHWKTIAIIFITLFVLETILVIWFISLGISMNNRETECSVNICGEVENTVSYQYDDYDQMCYCVDSNNEVIKQQFIK